MTRRTLLTAGFSAAGRRPNVVVFMTDQESALLPGPAVLPNRAKLGAAGTVFTHAFCNTPQCSAARAALLTGLEPHKVGVLTNVDASSLGKELSANVPCLGGEFAKHGYATGYFGKWHLGKSTGGFEAFRENEVDAETVREATAWIRKQTAPYFCWISILNPHHIYEIPRIVRSVPVRSGVRPPASSLANLAGKPAEQRAYVDRDQGQQTRGFSVEDWLRYRSFYLELVEKTDVLLGTVLEATNLEETVVACTSDHGDSLGEHGLPYKGPFMYEEQVRIPLVLAGRGVRRRIDGRLVTQCDLAPTLAEAAGVAWPFPCDGKSLLHPFTRDAVFLEYYAKQKWVNPIRTIRTRTHKLNLYDSGHREIYDLREDPHELRNIAGTGGLENRLEARIDAWRPPLTGPAAASSR